MKEVVALSEEVEEVAQVDQAMVSEVEMVLRDMATILVVHSCSQVSVMSCMTLALCYCLHLKTKLV